MRSLLLLLLSVIVLAATALHVVPLYRRSTGSSRFDDMCLSKGDPSLPYLQHVHHSKLTLSRCRYPSALLLSSEDDSFGSDFEQRGLDMFGDSVDQDAETLEKLRKEKVIDNDRWQSCMFREGQSGVWSGIYEVLVPKFVDNTFNFEKVESGMVSTYISSGTYSLEGVDITVVEDFSPSFRSPDIDIDFNRSQQSLLTPSIPFLYPSSKFRTSCGNQMVGNAFTLCSVEEEKEAAAAAAQQPSDEPSVPETYSAVLAVREESLRTRVRYVYTKCATKALQSGEHEKYDMSLYGITVVREVYLGDSSNKDPASAGNIPSAIDYNVDTLGVGIYDPQETGEEYMEVQFPGKLTLRFPRGLRVSRSKPAALTMQWSGRIIRYQLDRKFSSLKEGAISTFELTEVRSEDAELWPAGFPEPPTLLK